jgi:hypothetical protein
MHIPSEEIYRHLVVESSGIWFAPTLGADTHAILLKLPSSMLKSIIKGSEIKVGFSIRNTPSGKVLMSVMYVYDDQSMPSITVGPEITRNQQVALLEILRDRENTPVFFYDELSRNVAQAECAFQKQKDEIVKLIGSVDDLYAGDTNSDIKSALDHLESVADTIIAENTLKTDYISVVEVFFSNFVEVNLHVIGNRNVSRFRITDPDEGDGLEQSVWHLLIDLFQNDIYRSPQVAKGKSKRELTDILAISEYGLFIFESKSLAILSVTKEQSTARRAKNIEAHIKKALNQLLGATRSIQNGLEIYSLNGQIIDFNRSLVPHGIVLISEMFPAADWDAMFLELAQATSKSNIILHILDLRELARLVIGSKSANIFDHYLLQRAHKVIELENVLIRVNFVRDGRDLEN